MWKGAHSPKNFRPVAADVSGMPVGGMPVPDADTLKKAALLFRSWFQVGLVVKPTVGLP